MLKLVISTSETIWTRSNQFCSNISLRAHKISFRKLDVFANVFRKSRRGLTIKPQYRSLARKVKGKQYDQIQTPALETKMVKSKMSPVMRKPDFCICENKDADQLRGYREADQRLCFRYTDSTIPLLPKSHISSI